MKQLKVVLALITQDNDYQREQASVAEKTAQRLGIQLKVVYANSDAIAQTQQILAAIHAATPDRPDAVIVEPVGTGMPQVASAAAHNGIGWVVLNREADYLAPLRTSPIPIGSVDCDNLEVGRIQGRQFAALLPAGGTVLYVEGPSADVAKQRRTGMEETKPASIQISAVRGKWTEESGYQGVSSRLQLHGSRPPNVHLIGCQNDAMAMGARRAVEALAAPEYRADWLRVPFTGIDGVPTSGQVWVRNGQLTATIITPALSGIALEMVAKSLSTGTQMPERTLTRPISFPPIEELKPVAVAAAH